MAGFYGELAGKAGSDNESQISDVDPAEMAKMLEGLDDMDSDLFGSSLKNRKGKSLASPTAQAKSVLKSPAVDDGERQGKSRVTFGLSDKEKRSTPRKSQTFDDFDIDDPLADLLSDEDSDVKKKTRRASPARSKLSTDAQDQQHTVNTNKESKLRSKTVADLFGLDDDEKDKEVVGNPSLSAPAKPIKENPPPPKSKFLTNDLESSNVKTTPLRTSKKSDVIDNKVTNPSPRPRSEGVKFDDGDDILDSMGFGGDRNRGSRRGLGTGKPSQSRPSVMDELLGKPPLPEKEEVFNINHLEVKKSASKPELREDSGVSFGDYSPTVTTGREGRRLSSRRNTTALGDPVGLFSSSTTPQRHSFQEGMGESYGYEASPMKGKPNFSDRFGEEMNSLSPRHRSPAPNQGTEPLPRSRHAAKQSPVQSNPLTPQNSIAVADDLPEWLGGGGGKKKQIPSEVPTQHPAPVEPPPPPPPPQVHPQAPVVQTSTVVGELFLNSQLEQQVVLALQRQEAALLAATGLKAHEAQLSEVQRRQQLLLEQQETQLRQLVERQVERQRQLEQTLRVQQERITSHMQALLSEPPGMVIMETPKLVPSTLVAPPAQTTVQTPTVTSAPVPPPESEPVPESVQTSVPAPPRVSVAVETDPINSEELIETQVTLQKCELQKTYLEAKLENLETKHKEEVQLLEECYKRQMSILEEAIVNQEARLRAENQRLEADYKDRILKMQELHAQLVDEHGRQLSALQQERLADLQKLREQQQAMLEHVRQAQQAETSAIKDASEHVTSLQSTVEILSRSAGGLGALQGKLEEQQRLQSSAREAAIKAKEEDLRALQESLRKQQEAVEKENLRLKGLEATLSSHRRELEEERQSQQRETEKLEVEQQRLESQRKQLESMKLALLEEQKAWRQQFSEERMSLAAEKSRLETMARLQNASSKQDEVAQLKAEAEAQLAVAREAAERAQLERTSLKEQQRHLDSERRRLTEMEHDLTVRAREVEGLAQIAKSTRNDSVEALAEASRMERTTTERALELKQQLKDLQEREQRLAQEKRNLSQERLSLRKSRDQKLCSSCKGLLVRQSSSPDHSRAASITFSDKFVDPKLVIMKLAAEREREALESNLSVLHSISK
ncbi:fas-binding factor 1 isoform X2 [Anabrus simplex]|uniref:fas-binding factor 1 isoform X2 n=1 Tax=Anabrus simplex TaxID=316456 RepID=UPI0035A27282